MTKRKGTPEQYLMDNFIPEPNSGCWLWLRSILNGGYGQIKIEGKLWQAHRFAWKVFRGEIPRGALVLHHCDVPSCVNPDHLFLGTNIENMNDMRQKGRASQGERHARAKLTKANVLAIRRRWTAGETMSSLAEVYGVTKGCIQFAAKGWTWKRVVS
ncbi:MAG TPA: HNH endonuclease [Caulobacteraceae bacterium]|jgi:hypothetical protein